MSTTTTYNSLLAMVGGVTGAVLGGMDGLLYALTILVVLDYLSGVASAIVRHRLSSAVGYIGIMRKVFIFLLVALANLIDRHVLGQPGVLRAAVLFFYISNESISILENATKIGLPVPDKLTHFLKDLHNKEE